MRPSLSPAPQNKQTKKGNKKLEKLTVNKNKQNKQKTQPLEKLSVAKSCLSSWNKHAPLPAWGTERLDNFPSTQQIGSSNPVSLGPKPVSSGVPPSALAMDTDLNSE